MGPRLQNTTEYTTYSIMFAEKCYCTSVNTQTLIRVSERDDNWESFCLSSSYRTIACLSCGIIMMMIIIGAPPRRNTSSSIPAIIFILVIVSCVNLSISGSGCGHKPSRCEALRLFAQGKSGLTQKSS